MGLGFLTLRKSITRVSGNRVSSMEMDTKRTRLIILCMLGNILRVLSRGRDAWYTRTVVFTLVNTETRFHMEWVTFSIPTRISTSDNSSREKNTEKATISLVKEQYSVVVGKTIRKYKVN
jgi:hypothetical protein